MKQIPTIIETYSEGSMKDSERGEMQHEYEPTTGEKILVQLWVRYPSYDFIFGTPAMSNPKYGKEFGFFQFRKLVDGKAKSGWYVYVDQAELEEMVEGWATVLQKSREERDVEWVRFDARKGRIEK